MTTAILKQREAQIEDFSRVQSPMYRPLKSQEHSHTGILLRAATILCLRTHKFQNSQTGSFPRAAKLPLSELTGRYVTEGSRFSGLFVRDDRLPHRVRQRIALIEVYGCANAHVHRSVVEELPHQVRQKIIQVTKHHTGTKVSHIQQKRHNG